MPTLKNSAGQTIETGLTNYTFRYKKGLYYVRVQPDIACRGGWSGKGCTTSINPICADGVTIMSECRGYQGRHSKAGLIRIIKANDWDKR